MQNRRDFIKQSMLLGGGLMVVQSGFAEPASDPVKKLTILHTNDVHSRLEPFPMDGGRNQGLGGVAPRAELIKDIRKEAEVLLLDAGDIFQGTPYFNIYKGEPEMKAMAAMGYEAVTMGNHDFDAGLENFATQLLHANFPVIICNYDFTDTPMEGKSQPYTIIRKGKLKIGITGVGIEMRGLVPDNLMGNTKYLDPVVRANEVSADLKKNKACDMVICLSHLGYKYKPEEAKVSDLVLAAETEHIDLIIGGHTHTFLNEPTLLKNKKGSDVLVNQVGWGGLVLGRLDFEFSRIKKAQLSKAHTVVVGKKARE
ncbi:MAG: metallophosphatase [Bacteroidota bacterium]